MNDNVPTSQRRYSVTPLIPSKRRVSARFTLPQSFYDKLMEELLRVQQHNRPPYSPVLEALSRPYAPQQDQPSDLPSKEQLESLIETAFWTSIEPEEGKLSSFTLVFVPAPGDAKPQAIDDDWEYHFAKPIRFCVEEVSRIAKLAPAVRRPGMWLTISPSKDKKQLLSVIGVGHISQVGVRVNVLAPGHLVVEYSGKRIATISGNKSLCLTAEDRFHGKLWNKLDDHSTDREWREFVREVIVETIRTMRTLGCGGSLVILPENDNWKKSVQGDSKYAFAGCPSFARSLYNLLTEARESVETFLCEEMQFDNPATR